MSASPVNEIAYICDEMRAIVKPGETITNTYELLNGLADRIGQQHKRLGMAILDFCNAFTLVYPPNDHDCPALLAAAFDEFKEAMGIETVDMAKESEKYND